MEYIFLSGEVGWEITPTKLQEQFDELDGQDVTVYVNTVGGFAFDGIAIYDFLKLKQSQGYNISTVATGVTASAGTLIFLAGNKSLRKAHESVTFLIHKAWSMSAGNGKDLEKEAQELKALDEKLAKIYAAETDLTEDDALAIMEEDKSLDINFLLEKGFISEIITYEAVASIKRNLNLKNKKKMAETKLSNDDKSWLESMFDSLKKLTLKPQNKIVQDATGIEIDFYELEDDATPKVGDKAKVDGKAADGEYVMPSGETYVFANGELTEIKPKEDDTEDVEELKKEIADLKDQLSEAQNSIKAVEEAKEKELKQIKNQIEEFEKNIKTKFNLDMKQEPANSGAASSENKVRNRKIFK